MYESLQGGSKFNIGTIKAKREKYGKTGSRGRMEKWHSEKNKSSVSERICLESKQVRFLSKANVGKTVNSRRCRSCGERRPCCKSVFLCFQFTGVIVCTDTNLWEVSKMELLEQKGKIWREFTCKMTLLQIWTLNEQMEFPVWTTETRWSSQEKKIHSNWTES